MRGWKIGSFGGIDIEINYTWLFLFALLTWSMSVHLRHAQEGLTEWVYWTGGVLTSLLFLASVLAHEMSHSLVARSLGMGVKRITLFIFGGVSQIEEEPRTPRIELLMTVVGPGTSAVLGVIFTGLARMGQLSLGWPPLVVSGLQLIGYINLALAVFNLLPAFPLDGGRLLRSALWSAWNDEYRATQVATALGSGLGTLMMITGGAFFLLLGNSVQGIWFLFLGWLILSAARQSAQMNEYKFRLSGLQAGQVMFWPLVSIPVGMRLSEALHSPVSATGQPLYPVVDLSGQAVGVLDHRSLTHVTPAQWAELSVGEVMSPLEPEMQIQAHAPVAQALTRLGSGREWLLVISPENRPVGVVTEQSIVRAAGRRGPAPSPR